MAADRGVEIYSRAPGRSRRYQYTHNSEAGTPTGKPASIVENEDGSLKVRDVGRDLASKENMEYQNLREHLNSFGGEWFWEDLRTPDGTEWLAAAMRNGTLTCVTDGSFMQNLNVDASGAGWII